jgi:hypothetical protein
MNPRIQKFSLCLILPSLLSVAGYGQGIVAFRHTGAANPTTEGFTLLQGGNPTLAPVVGDAGYDAWSIHLGSLSDIAQYSAPLTALQQAQASDGWVMSLSLRILPQFNDAGFGIFGSFATGTKIFSLQLGALPSGDPIVRVGNTRLTLNGAGSSYHNYQLRYDRGQDTASLWIDGAELLTGISGATVGGTPAFSWGGGQNGYGNLGANWSEAAFTIVPEPTALALGLCGWGLWLAARRRHAA